MHDVLQGLVTLEHIPIIPPLPLSSLIKALLPGSWCDV